MNVGSCSLAQDSGRASWKRVDRGEFRFALPNLACSKAELLLIYQTDSVSPYRCVTRRTSDPDFQQLTDVIGAAPSKTTILFPRVLPDQTRSDLFCSVLRIKSRPLCRQKVRMRRLAQELTNSSKS